jgi:sugar transferase (PEP-CTERM system associated)
VIRLFNHYVSSHVLRQMLFDVGVVWLAMACILVITTRHPDLLSSMVSLQGLVVGLLTFAIAAATGAYRRSPQQSSLRSVLRGVLAAALLLPAGYMLIKLLPAQVQWDDRLWIAATCIVTAALAWRLVASQMAANTARRSRVLVLGAGPLAKIVGDTLAATDRHSEVVGYMPGATETERVVPEALTVKGTQSLATAAARSGAGEIVVALTERRGGAMSLRDLLECKSRGIHVSDISTYFEKTLGQIQLDYVNAGWLIFGDGFNQGMVRTAVKRVFDLLGSAVLMVVGAPIMLLTALAIKLDSAGPVFYRQERVGKGGIGFDVIKFRSMRTDAEKDGKPQWASATDNRVTRVGKFIRLVRIDELPQLYNVFKGDMSLVGPRPERPFFVDQLTQDIPYYALRHSVKPGVTGWAQVRYEYGSTVEDARQKLQYDLYYVKNHTLFLDFLIMLETVSVVLTGKGAR